MSFFISLPFVISKKIECSFIGAPLVYNRKLVGIVGKPGQCDNQFNQMVTGKVFFFIFLNFNILLCYFQQFIHIMNGSIFKKMI
jgi:hypothetical protein